MATVTATAGARRAGRWRRAVVTRIPGLVLLVALLALWQLMVSVGDIQPMLLPGPALVVDQLGETWQIGLLQRATIATLYALGVGLVLGSVAGLLLGLIIGMMPRVDLVASPYMWGVFSTPDIALVPIVILWFGFGTVTKVGMVFLAVMIPLALSCKDGVRTIDRSLVRAAVSFCANRRDVFRKVIVPSTVPSIATGMRNGISRGFVGVLVVEMTVGTDGLGREVMYAMRQFNTARMFAFVAILVVIAVLLITLSKRLESLASRWREEVSL